MSKQFKREYKARFQADWSIRAEENAYYVQMSKIRTGAQTCSGTPGHCVNCLRVVCPCAFPVVVGDEVYCAWCAGYDEYYSSLLPFRAQQLGLEPSTLRAYFMACPWDDLGTLMEDNFEGGGDAEGLEPKALKEEEKQEVWGVIERIYDSKRL